jgi:class 3 adenylate cyclase/tetratricopeptide (TPR) repeat protein
VTLRAGTWTVLFTDVVGSTDQRVRLGDAAVDEMLREHDAVVGRALAAHGGELVEGTGDGAMCAFVGAADALAAAVAIQQRLERRNREAPEQLHLRVGVSLGDLAFEDGGLHGLAAHEAARVCASAEAGEILVSDVVRSVAGSRAGCELIARGELELKGLPAPVRVWRVAWEPELGPAWGVPLPLRVEAAQRSVFVGRATERAGLAETLKQVRGGERRVVMVGGEAGIGKTALMSTLAADAHAQGAVVLYGRCDEDLGIPYQPWAEALAELVERAPEPALEAHVTARGGDLVALVPGLSRRLVDAPAPRSSDPETERHLLFAAVVDLLQRAAAEDPVVLVLEDLHWADRPSLHLLRHVVATSGPTRMLVMGTFRAGDVGADDPLAEVLAALHREPGVDRLTLRGLDDLELLDLMQAAAGHEITDEGVALRDALSAETDGNPFFVLEILRHLAETGAIAQSDDGRWVAHLDLDAQGLPVSVREVLGRRVHRLGPEATRVLAAASVIGRDFEAALLGAVVDTDEEELLDVLDAAVRAAVIADVPGSQGRFAFVHALIQRALYDDLTTARRQRLHRRTAEALETLPGTPDERVGELARHWYAATQPTDSDKALRYSIAAGDRAQDGLAPDEAVRWYEQALEVVDRFDQPDRDETRCEVLLRLGTAQRVAGIAAFRQTLLDAAHLAQRIGDTARLVEAALTNTRGLVSHVGRLDVERIEVLRAALDATGTTAPSVRARLLAQWALETTYSPEYDTNALIAEATALTEAGDDPQARWHALYALHQNFLPHNLEERRACQAEFLELASGLDLAQQYWTYRVSVHLPMQLGDLAQATKFLDQMEQRADAVRDPTMRWLAEVYRSGVAAFVGDYATAEQHANAALQLGVDAAQPDALTFYGGLLGGIRRLAGREAELCDLLAQRAADNPGVPAFRAALAVFLAASDRSDEARVVLDDFVGDLSHLWVDPVWATTLAFCADAAARTEHGAAARAILPLLAPFTDQWTRSGGADYGPVALATGMARTVLADYEQAEADFAQAHTMAERAGTPYWTARTKLEWAVMLSKRGETDDHDRARTLLDGALATAREHGFAGIERRSTALHGRLVSS